MRTRALYEYIDETGKKKTNVVWFGSTGVKRRGFDFERWDEAKWDDSVFYSDGSTSFSTKQQSVVDSLTQRLSIIRKELWYDYSYGMPLTEKNRSKVEVDSWILSVVAKHPDVSSILSFSSEVSNGKYSCSIKVKSIYGEVDINL